MAEYTTSRPYAEQWATMFHEGLVRLGLDPADFRVEAGGLQGQHFFRVASETMDLDDLERLVEAANRLYLSADKVIMDADGADVITVTCADKMIAGDASVDYQVWLDGVVYAERDSVPVASGQVQLALATDLPGEYMIAISRQGTSGIESGYLVISAKEV